MGVNGCTTLTTRGEDGNEIGANEFSMGVSSTLPTLIDRRGQPEQEYPRMEKLIQCFLVALAPRHHMHGVSDRCP
ncbi:hypothetical protein V6N13_019892 [Hibiscus sabdariffa]|uniref:Uncharacterized protein n=1 Tax=Hibiscus sabdariffa TaxID=183260 RepID=A0ABR2ETR6_9ROSI